MKRMLESGFKPLPITRDMLLGIACLPAAFATPIPILTSAGGYTQDFNTLPSSGTSNPWSDGTTLAGWYALHGGTNQYVIAGAGGSITGGLYSFGAAASTERALGSLGSEGTGTISYGVLLHNTSGSAITLNALSYTGEQWRNGGNSTTHKLTLSYQKSQFPITTPGSASGWTAVPAADFTSPIATTAAGALDGNLAANLLFVSANPDISVTAGEYIMLRWQDPNDSGSDHGLAIDDVSLAWIANATPALTLSASPTTFCENAGAVAATGTLSIPTPAVTDLVISLASSDTTEAKVPDSVTLTAGHTSATFPIEAVDDLLADGSQAVTITAAASSYLATQMDLAVDDDTDAPIAVAVAPASFAESAGADAASGTVTLAQNTATDLTIYLDSSDTTEASVDSSVTIPAGQKSANFIVDAVDDGDVDGTRNVTIQASATGYSTGSTVIQVTDGGDVIAPPTLSPGAIAFVGFNADGDDDLAFVALVPIAASDTILFTDKEWNGLEVGAGGEFTTGEGIITWAAPAGGVAAGTVVTLNHLSSVNRSANVGALTPAAGLLDLNVTGETVYAYQGTATSTTGFLAIIATQTSDPTAGTGLSASHIIYLTDEADVAVFTGPRSNKPAFAAYLAAVGVPANWLTEDGSGDQSINATAPNVPFDTAPFTLTTNSSYAAWAALNAGGQAADLDHDNDCVCNGVEYFMGAPGASHAPGPALVNRTVTWPHSASATGISFRVLTSDNLTSWNDITADTIDANGTLAYTLPGGQAQIFVRLEVVVP